MAALFHLVRHGAYELLDHALGGRGAYPLSPQGREQAERVGAALAPRRPVGVVSSPVSRARETADLIARRLDLEVELEPAFSEINFADWTGARFQDLGSDPTWHAWNGFRSTAAVPGGEGMLAVQGRAIAGLVRHARSDGELVIVTHADIIKAMLMHFLGAPLDLMRRLEIGPGSISQLLLLPDDARVLAINAQC
jgi:broad specificity phosphatase PhoE